MTTTIDLAPPAALDETATLPPFTPSATPLGLVERLLRDPETAITELLHTDGLSPIALRTLLGATAIGAGLYGAVLGATRGRWQVLFCAVKLPLVLLMTLVLCTAPFVALGRVSGVALPARTVVALTLASCARLALLLAGLAPVLWLFQTDTAYHRIILGTVAACALAGVSAGTLLFRGLARAGAPTRTGVAWVCVFALVGSQTAWILRPFVVRPRTESVPIVRALEGDFLWALTGTFESAMRYGEAPRASVRGYDAPR